MATTEEGIYYPNDYEKDADVPGDMKKMAQSVDGIVKSLKNRTTVLETDNTTNKQNIQTLQTDNATNKKNIADLQENDETQDTEIEKLQAENEALRNQIPSGVATGETLHLTDSSDLPFKKFGIIGKSWQETREGYNLLNVPSEFEVTGSINKPVSLSAGEYTIKVDDIATTNESPTNFCFSFKDADGTIGDVRVPYTSKAKSFNLTRAATTVAIYSDNDWGSSQSVTTTYKNLMIYASTEDKDYEAYGESPSTDYPSTIRNAGEDGSVNFGVCNKNLCYNVAVTNSDNIDFYVKPKSIHKTFTLSFTTSTSLNLNSVYCRVDGVTQGGIIDKITAQANTRVTKEITLSDELYEKIRQGTSVYFRVYKGGANFTLPSDGMIENGATATEFEEHQEQSISFPMQEGQVLHEGDYLADDGTHHVRKQIVLDGTENWVLYSETANSFQLAISDGKACLCICTHYKAIRTGLANEDYACLVNNNAISIKDKDISTVEQLKSYLAQQKENGTPVIVEYDLAEEEIVPYNEAQQTARNQMKELETYRNVTNVFCTDETSCEFDTEYYKDLATMFTNQSQLILQGGN